MKRILPFPLMAVTLLVMWLLLQQSVSLGHLLLGSFIAVVACLAMAALQPSRPKVRRPHLLLGVAGRLAIDIAQSNIAVAGLILSAKRQKSAAFVTVPLQLKDTFGLAILSGIVTSTPGSAWVEYDPVRSTVLIHVLELEDEKAWVETLKNRYEKPLLEVFG